MIFLDQNEMPDYFYNIVPDLPTPLDPPLDPRTKKPVKTNQLEALFPKALVEQEVSTRTEIKIQGKIREMLSMYRPSPLIRAKRLEEHLKTPARIYYKYEGVSPTGSHKSNTALVQAYFAKQEGVQRLVTETGAGQWGSALSFACSMVDLKTTVYMVRISYDQKPYRKVMMRTYGADVFSSPSKETKAGRQVLKDTPKTHGSLGIAISEAIDDVLSNDRVKYSTSSSKYGIGSVLNFVCLHQTIIGLEAKKQFEKISEYPDIIIGCTGGGSNFAGISFPFIRDRLSGKKLELRSIAVESKACPSMTKGEYKYDSGDTTGLTPLIKMHSVGKDFIPDPIHAGGLRYHGMAPVVSRLVEDKIIEARAYGQAEVFRAALTFARSEGLIVAPETAHAVKAVIDEADLCSKSGEEKVILFNLSGHGFFDLKGYEDFLDGNLN